MLKPEMKIFLLIIFTEQEVGRNSGRQIRGGGGGGRLGGHPVVVGGNLGGGGGPQGGTNDDFWLPKVAELIKF